MDSLVKPGDTAADGTQAHAATPCQQSGAPVRRVRRHRFLRHGQYLFYLRIADAARRLRAGKEPARKKGELREAADNIMWR